MPLTYYVVDAFTVSRTAAGNLVRAFEGIGIIERRDKERARYRQYLYEGYLVVLRQGGEPL